MFKPTQIKRIYFLHVLLIILCPIPHFSQDTTKKVTQPNLNELRNMELDELLNIKINTKVVSASKKKQNISEAPANITVITKKDIENRGYRTIEEALKDLPGFDFATGQPSGEFPANFLFRGIGDVGQTKFVIMVDGVPLNDVSNGWIRNIGHNFSLMNVERIELVSGAGSSLYGLNSFAGYINIITQEIESGTHISGSLQGGSFTTTGSEASISHKFFNGVSLRISGKYYQTRGDEGINRYDPGNYFHNNFEPDSIFTNQHGTIPNNTDTDGNTSKLADGFNTSVDDYFIRGKLSSGKITLNFSNWRKKEGLGSHIVGYEYFTNTDGVDYISHHKGSLIDLTYKTTFEEKISSKTKSYYYNTSILPQTGFSYTYQFNDVNNGINSPTNLEKKTYQNEGFLIGLLHQTNYQISQKNEFVAGVQFEQKIRVHLNIDFVDVDSLDHIQTNNIRTLENVFFSKNGAFFLQDQHKFTEHLNLTIGARFDIDEFYGNSFNPKAAIVRHIPKGINYKILYEHGFKAPSVFELYDEWRGNDQLLPERINTGQVILSYDWENMNIISSTFVNSINDLIVVAPNTSSDIAIGPEGQKTTIYQNLGNKMIIGGSIKGRIQATENLLLNLGYNYLIDNHGDILDNTSMHKMNFAVNYLIKNKININLRGNYISKIKAPLTNLYYYDKTPSTINTVGYDYVTEENPDGFLNGSFIFNGVITGQNIIKNKRIRLEPQIIVKNIFNTSYAYMGRQSGDGVRPIDEIQTSIKNPNGFIPAYHPQMGREIYLRLNIIFN